MKLGKALIHYIPIFDIIFMLQFFIKNSFLVIWDLYVSHKVLQRQSRISIENEFRRFRFKYNKSAINHVTFQFISWIDL